MRIDLSALRKVPAEEILSFYTTQHEFNLAHVQLMAKCVKMDFYIRNEDPEFCVVYDPSCYMYRIFAENVECFKQGMDAIVKNDPNNRNSIYIRANDKFTPIMEEIFTKHGRQTKQQTMNLWAIRKAQLPHPDSDYVKAATKYCVAPKDPMEVLRLLKERKWKHPILDQNVSDAYAHHIVTKLPSAVIYDKKGEIVTYCCTHSDGSIGFGFTRDGERNKGLNVGATVFNYLQMVKVAQGNLPVLLTEINVSTNADALYSKTPMQLVDRNTYFVGFKPSAKM